MEKKSQTGLRGLSAWLVCLLVLVHVGCEPEVKGDEVSVFTEEIVFSSGESAIMTGRILAQGTVEVGDHGFEIDSIESFPQPQQISLGAAAVPGRFVGEIHSLQIRRQYYCRAYLEERGVRKTGNVLSFSTVAPKAVDFSPKEGFEGVPITLEGFNLPSDTRVLWNNQVIVPDDLLAESIVSFQVPTIGSVPEVQIGMTAQGDTVFFDTPFEYIIGEWENVITLDDPQRNQRHIYFEEGDDFVYGLGLAMGHITNAVQIMNKTTFQRTTLSFPSVATEGAFFSEGYFGGGSTAKVTSPSAQLSLSKEFWKYENGNFIRLADVPVALYKAACLISNNKLYLYGGERFDRSRNLAIYAYDIGNNTWSAVGPSPFTPLNSLPSFRLGAHHYFVTEEGQTWRQYPMDNSWLRLSDYPAPVSEYGVSLISDGKAFVGMFGNAKKMVEYRPGSDTWRTKAGFLESSQNITIGGWSSNGFLYVVRIQSSAGTTRELWRLAPDVF